MVSPIHARNPHKIGRQYRHIRARRKQEGRLGYNTAFPARFRSPSQLPRPLRRPHRLPTPAMPLILQSLSPLANADLDTLRT
ncbi:MAG: hypothetical protein AAB419_12980, partial [Pseudomonadota bacterium]